MHRKLTLGLADAKAIAGAAEAYARSRDLNVSIAIVDESTYLQHLVRMDGAPYLTPRRRDREGPLGGRGWSPDDVFRTVAERPPVLHAEDACLPDRRRDPGNGGRAMCRRDRRSGWGPSR